VPIIAEEEWVSKRRRFEHDGQVCPWAAQNPI
jgi:hypothetical protein